MSITWAKYRTQIKRSILEDENNLVWSDEQLLDYFSWAVDNFVHHTALAKTITFNDSTVSIVPATYDMATATEFYLPDDVFEDVSISGLVYGTVEGERQYYDPLDRTIGISIYQDSGNFYETYGSKLRILEPLGSGNTLTVRYFSYYPTVENDNDTIDLPRWAYVAVAHLMGYYALSPVAIGSANIDRWKDRTDSGNPETNALAEQQRQMQRVYNSILVNHPRQDRENFFRAIS